jgi:catechol 2,3-dioxygenase-like lactoylglutathione lyase family enzyme
MNQLPPQVSLGSEENDNRLSVTESRKTGTTAWVSSPATTSHRRGQVSSGHTVFEDVAPVLPVLDLDAALDRYRRLGFNARAYTGEGRYGFVERDAVSIHLTESAEHDPRTTASVVYLDVTDADAVYAEWTAAGVEGRLGEPRDTEYGMREFAYVDPDGSLHRVGSTLAT